MPAATDLPGLQSVGLHQVWQRQMRLEPGERVKKAWRLGRSLYVATTDSRIVRVDAKTGVLKWSQGLGAENFEIYQPIELKSLESIPTGEVLVVTRGEAFIFNMETGDQVRMQRMNISVSTDPVVVGNTLCIGGADTFYGMYLDRLGMKRWKIPQPGDLFISAPAAMDNNVLLASRAGHLWRITADTGDWEWKDRKTNGLITAGLAADFNAVYVPCDDQRVYAFRTDTGGELWEQQLDDRLEETAVMAGPVILVTSVNRKMSALARQTGVVKWTQDDVWQVATVNEETVWIGDSSGKIRLLALDTGAEKAAALTTGIQLFVRNNMDQNVILVTHAGLIGMYSPSTVNEKPE
jgi:outer membrane protein assembly factor BamB